MNTVIAVLSTVILAVTVLTLFLGILAYIVYKARKRSGKKRPLPTKTVERIEPIQTDMVKTPTVTEEKKSETSTPPAQPPDSGLPRKAGAICLDEGSIRPVNETPSLIRRYEPETKKDKRAEWR
jgi:cytoskeletal protein RodZ